MIISLNSTAGGASAIGYGLTKKRDIKQADNILAKQNENVAFVRTDNMKVNTIFGAPTPSEVYRHMTLRHQVAGMKRKDRFWNIKICPSKDDWKALLGFEPIPGKLTDEQKEKVLEVANKLIDASIEKLDQTDHWGYRTNKKTDEKYSCITGKHTNLADSQAVWAVHFDTDDLHIHGVANKVTEHNEIQEANKCNTRGFLAGDKVAEKFGLKQLSEYDNQRKERIHADGIAVLKGMKEFNLQTYFAEMIAKGWVIDPNTPDSKGIIHGYSVGEMLYHNDGSLSSVIMFKSSELGHSKDLTPSHLLKTWQKVHAEERETVHQPKQQTAPVVPIAPRKPGRWDEDERRIAEAEKRKKEEKARVTELQRVEKSKQREQSQQQQEARSAVSKALSIIRNFVNEKFNVYDRDEQAGLLEGIVGKCLLGGHDSSDRNNLISAANELMEMVTGPIEQLNKSLTIMTDMLNEQSILPPVSLSAGPSGGGTGSSGGWRKKDDDEWEWWKRNGFRLMRARGKGRS